MNTDDAGFDARSDGVIEDDDAKVGIDIEWRNKRKQDVVEECYVCGESSRYGFYRVEWRILESDSWPESSDGLVDGVEKVFVCSGECKRKLRVRDAL